jgi:hypothetical protein
VSIHALSRLIVILETSSQDLEFGDEGDESVTYNGVWCEP